MGDDAEMDWAALFGDRADAVSNLSTVRRARDLHEAREFAATAVEAATDARDLAEMAMDAGKEARESADKAFDVVCQSRDLLDEYVRTAKTCTRLDVGVLVAAALILVLTVVNFYG